MLSARNILFVLLLAFCSTCFANERLLGKKAIITGGDKGIGKAIALGFSKEGADVVIGYCTDKEAALTTVKELAAYGFKANAIQVDMSDSKSIAQFFMESVDYLGDVDVLVNNAGILSHAPFVDVAESDLDRVMSINLRGPFILLQFFCKHLKNIGHGGSAINVSSISAYFSTQHLTAYQCSKAALSMLTKGAALEMAPFGIRINTLAPGLTATDLNRFLWEGEAAEWQQRSEEIPLRCTGLPQDQVGAAVFLASDESSWMTGASITVDGGVERR